MNVHFARVEVSISCLNTIDISMVMPIFDSFPVLSLAFDPHKIIFLVLDAIVLIDFSPSEAIWPIPNVPIASRSTLFDPGTDFNQFKRSSYRWLYCRLSWLAFSNCNSKRVRRRFSSVFWWSHYFSQGLCGSVLLYLT